MKTIYADQVEAAIEKVRDSHRGMIHDGARSARATCNAIPAAKPAQGGEVRRFVVAQSNGDYWTAKATDLCYTAGPLSRAMALKMVEAEQQDAFAAAPAVSSGVPPVAQVARESDGDCLRALNALSMAMGNPCLEATGDQTFADALVKFAIDRYIATQQPPHAIVREVDDAISVERVMEIIRTERNLRLEKRGSVIVYRFADAILAALTADVSQPQVAQTPENLAHRGRG